VEIITMQRLLLTSFPLYRIGISVMLLVALAPSACGSTVVLDPQKTISQPYDVLRTIDYQQETEFVAPYCTYTGGTGNSDGWVTEGEISVGFAFHLPSEDRNTVLDCYQDLTWNYRGYMWFNVAAIPGSIISATLHMTQNHYFQQGIAASEPNPFQQCAMELDIPQTLSPPPAFSKTSHTLYQDVALTTITDDHETTYEPFSDTSNVTADTHTANRLAIDVTAQMVEWQKAGVITGEFVMLTPHTASTSDKGMGSAGECISHYADISLEVTFSTKGK
jgi:hypothetical protein